MSNNYDLEIFAYRLKEARKALGLSQTQLGKKVGLDSSSISRYEKAKVKNVMLPVIQELAEALHVSPSWLAGVSDNILDKSLNTIAISNDEGQLIEYYRKLNKVGKEFALIQLENLALNERYVLKENEAKNKSIIQFNNYPELAAAHDEPNNGTYTPEQMAEFDRIDLEETARIDAELHKDEN